MKKSFESVLLATLTVLFLCNPTNAQDFQSPYFNKTPLDPIDDLSIVY